MQLPSDCHPRGRLGPEGDVAVIWAAATFAIAAIVAALCVGVTGADDKGVSRALLISARLSFVLFWLAYTGRSLVSLFGDAFAFVRRHGREFGLSFASTHIIHVTLALWLYQIVTKPPLPPGLLLFFSIGSACTFGLAVLSFCSVLHFVGAELARVLRLVGMEYISLLFLYDFASHPLRGDVVSLSGYLPFLALSILGISLRIVARIVRGATATQRASIPASSFSSTLKSGGLHK